jgi:PAS domain S-box-containing protein
MCGVNGISKERRKKLELVLAESEKKYRTLFEEAIDSIFIVDVETGIITDCNKAALKLVGREKSELIGELQKNLHQINQLFLEFQLLKAQLPPTDKLYL